MLTLRPSMQLPMPSSIQFDVVADGGTRAAERNKSSADEVLAESRETSQLVKDVPFQSNPNSPSDSQRSVVHSASAFCWRKASYF